MKTLLIVESPTKAKTISKFLGREYTILSSFGHVRDLPKSKLGVDVEHNFLPHYIVSRDKGPVVKEIKAAAKKANQVLFATDADREGEAISYHLASILDIAPENAKRITFHEITKPAIMAALEHPRALDIRLVDAQQARRVLDRLVGYNLSPFLWRKIAKGLSAGRVQSVAVRLIVEREREITAFKPTEYWSIEGSFAPEKDEKSTFEAKLIALPDKKLDKLDLKNQATVDEITAALKGASYSVADVDEKATKRHPLPPYTTSTLQQDANHRLGFSAKQTMRLAQQLYEGVEVGDEGSVGLITYMRTDAVNLAESFIQEARAVITEQFGKKYCPSAPRYFKNKNKNAQEAHEAIRPTAAARSPEALKPYLDRNQLKLYQLIWARAVATQMAPAEFNSGTVDVISSNKYLFRATGQTMLFEGFLALYPDKGKETILPKVTVGAPMTALSITPEQHFTEPPARYSDATLVKALEEYGIGRPSTYAPTIATIEERGYVVRDEKKKLTPTEIAYTVNDLLVQHFPTVVDFQFTAQLEEHLDEIARGEREWQPTIADFYTPFNATLMQKDAELKKKELTETATNEVCSVCGKPMVIKIGRFGKFLACTGYPECKHTRPLGAEAAASEAAEAAADPCEKCGAPMIRRVGRFGPFLGCSTYPKCKNIRPLTAKLNIKCPTCTEGDMAEKRTKRGKVFYGCSRYPECTFALWDKPTGEKCPECQSLLVYKNKTVRCSSENCTYVAPSKETASAS